VLLVAVAASLPWALQWQESAERASVRTPAGGLVRSSLAASLHRSERAAGAVPAYLEGTAIITLATGEESARHVVALVQSLRDTGTQVPRIVALVSRGGRGSSLCLNRTLMDERGRGHVACDSPTETTLEELTDAVYLDALARLGVEVMLIDPMPETNFTPAQRSFWW